MKVKTPDKKCEDNNCPFHGNLKTRGMSFTGVVISDKMRRTCTVEWERRNYLKKYERYEKRRTKIKSHNTDCINAKNGDIVKIIGCRPLSKTKNFVIVENLGPKKGFKERIEALEESRVKIEKKEKEESKENATIEG